MSPKILKTWEEHLAQLRQIVGAFPDRRTFAKYLAEVRVVKACTLLSDTNKSVAEIAIETGFGSVSNFNRRFLALKRTSPLRYRKLGATREAVPASASDRPER